MPITVVQLVVDGIARDAGEDVFDGDDHRRLVDDLAVTVDLGGEFAQRLRAVLRVRLGQHLLRVLVALGAGLRLDLRLEFLHHRLDVQVRVPDGEQRLIGELTHRRAVALGRGERELATDLRRAPVVPSCDDEACGQPLDVPLERSGQRLVEVVHVEDEPAFRRRERAEVGQVRVTAQLHPQPGRGSAGQVGGHGQRGAAVEGERRDQHAAVTYRQQFRHPRGFLLLEQPDRIPVRARLELGVRLQRRGSAGVCPLRDASARLRCSTGGRRAGARVLVLVVPVRVRLAVVTVMPCTPHRAGRDAPEASRRLAPGKHPHGDAASSATGDADKPGCTPNWTRLTRIPFAQLRILARKIVRPSA